MTTCEIPRLTLIEIYMCNGSVNEIEIGDPEGQIVGDELFISGMESKPWWYVLHFEATKGLMKTWSSTSFVTLKQAGGRKMGQG